MHRSKHLPLFLLAVLAILPAGCGLGGLGFGGDPPEPDFDAALFGATSFVVDNPWFPLVPGRAQVFVGETEDGTEVTIVEVLDETRVVAGVACSVVRDRVFEDELLMEDTYDWYAQDLAGNVWYLGEDSTSYERDEDGAVVGTSQEGSWETGQDVAGVGSLAIAGIQMKASPRPGDAYAQEIYPGVAEDMARILRPRVRVERPDGSVVRCLETLEWNPLDPGSEEIKLYAPGIGLVRETTEDGEIESERYGDLDVTDDALPDVGAATFTAPSDITNPWTPFAPGASWSYAGETDEGLEEVLVEVQPGTRSVLGLDCRIVRDRVFLDGVLVEDTYDWYAQDDDGNVWYMGEDVTDYEYDDDGDLVDVGHDGSWEAGVDGAQPGILMWATPVVGTSHRQEYLEGEAEDLALVFAEGADVELEDGTPFEDVLQTLEWSPLSPGAVEIKSYVAGLGLVREDELHAGQALDVVIP